tara:strand:+ start:631 stop:927 length:297 start_codon:yes stop_codon:yes gene_type:complete
MEETPKYPMPDIHFNGTDPVDLTEGYINIHKAISELESAINKSPFHSRDYYTLDWDNLDDEYTAFTAAQKERAKHLINLSEFKKYTEDHIMHIRNFDI